jgi:sulfur-oxidizing protein SoxX
MKKLLQLGTAAFLLPLTSSIAMANDRLAEGKEIAFDRKKGNCLACHVIEDGELPGYLGPPLMMMQARYPDREKLKAQIADATVRNPATSMPPYGKHNILTEEELEKVVDYIHSL